MWLLTDCAAPRGHLGCFSFCALQMPCSSVPWQRGRTWARQLLWPRSDVLVCTCRNQRKVSRAGHPTHLRVLERGSWRGARPGGVENTRFLLLTPFLRGTRLVLCKGGVTTDVPCGQMAAVGRSPPLPPHVPGGDTRMGSGMGPCVRIAEGSGNARLGAHVATRGPLRAHRCQLPLGRTSLGPSTLAALPLRYPC